MRASEFISEQTELYDREYAADHKHWEPREIPGAYTIPDASENFYKMYRYGILMARSPEPQPDAYDDQTEMGDKLIIVPYDQESGNAIIAGASAASGHAAVKSHSYTNKAEGKFVNPVSPVAKFVPTKRPSQS
jgi:hypothetical protein